MEKLAKKNSVKLEENVSLFEGITIRIVNITEDDKIFLFSKILPDNVRQVTSTKPKTLQEAIEQAQVYTTTLNVEKVNYIKSKSWNSKGWYDKW